MSNRYKKAMIEDTVSHGIDEDEQSNLLDLFEHAMKSIATTLAREARFDTSDFATAKERNCEGFQPKTGSYPVADSATGGVGGPMTGAMRSLM